MKIDDVNSSRTYRSDIDGLRAVAVLSVVFYHAGIPGLTGGFIGVDVFFVISGYLIAGIISREIHSKSFSITHFYERRARRILPALFVVIITTFIVGWVISWPSDFRQLAESAIAAVLFSSNLYFWQTTDYFATAAELQPLLHTWSLAVEEQFYIVFPLFLILIAGWLRLFVVASVALLFALSLIFSVIAAERSNAVGFYLAPSRAWELLCGVILALNIVPSWKDRLLREISAIIGLCMILVPVFAYDSTTVFPGLAALIPCAGAGLVIQSGRETNPPTFVAQMLSQRLLVFVGLISYSLYLWHWPLLAFAKAWFGSPDLSAYTMAAIILSSFGLAILSWRFVERPFRSRNSLDRRGVFFASGCGAIVILSVCSFTVVSSGVPKRFSEDVLQVLAGSQDLESNRLKCMGRKQIGDYCLIGKEGVTPTVLLWGDSQASAIMSAVGYALEASGKSAVLASRSVCPPLLGVRRSNWRSWEDCEQFNMEVAGLVTDDHAAIDTVILMARWRLNVTGERAPGEYGEPVQLASIYGNSDTSNAALVEAGLSETMRRLTGAGTKVIILGDLPEIGWDVSRMTARSMRFGIAPPTAPNILDVRGRNLGTDRILNRVSRKCGTQFVPLAPLLCEPRCVTVDGTAPIYVDGIHLSKHGGGHVLGPKLKYELLKIMN